MIKTKFTPFAHDNLSLKNELIDFARKVKGNTFQDDVTAAFIYASFAEYLSKHLLENLHYFIYDSTYRFFAGIIFMKSKNKKTSETLGQIIIQLERFEFPDKTAVIELLKRINKSRNALYHSFAASNINELRKLVNDDIKIIQEDTEELMSKINIIYAGLQKILNQEYKETNHKSEKES